MSNFLECTLTDIYRIAIVCILEFGHNYDHWALKG